MQIKNSHKVITGVTFLIVLLFITAFKMIESKEQAQNTSGYQTKADSPNIDIHILIMGDKVEALRKLITGQLEIQE